jgi:cysteinyl-tRNA synthetase
MSKSLGNFFTVREILKEYEAEVLRFLMLSSHYRSPINFSKELMEQSKNALERLYTALYAMEHLEKVTPERPMSPKEEEYLQKQLENKNKFIESMDDDFNTASAIAALFDIVREFNVSLSENSSKEAVKKTKELVLELGGVLGLFSKFQPVLLDEEIERMIKERQEARKAKNYARADKIRDELKARGIIIEDTPTGTRWRRA